jgi:hypothetical protein
MHRRLAIENPADRDRVGNLRMIEVPTLEQKPLILELPSRRVWRPDPERLATRFERFQLAG